MLCLEGGGKVGGTIYMGQYRDLIVSKQCSQVTGNTLSGGMSHRSPEQKLNPTLKYHPVDKDGMITRILFI